LEDELQKPKAFWSWSLLEEPHGDVRVRKKHRAPFQFQEKNPCKLQVIIKETLQFPGEF